jgi:hypothetical protein
MVLKNFAALAFAIALLSSSNSAMSADKNVSFLNPQFGGKILIWNLSGVRLGIPQGYTVATASSPSGDLQIGFTHSGYTVPGQSKRAELLISVTVDTFELSQDEKQLLNNQGVELLPDAKPDASVFDLDLSLQSDKTEEARLRTDLALPQTLRFGISQVLAFRWSDVKGSVLYDWLTNAAGLRLVVTATGVSKLHSQSGWAVDPTKLAAWWSTNVGSTNDRLVTADGMGILAFELQSSSVIVPVIAGSHLNRVGSQIQTIKGLEAKLLAISSPVSNGYHAIAFDAMSKLAIPVLESDDITNSTVISANMAPGAILKAHPEYVVDNSGAIPGLEALLRDR